MSNTSMLISDFASRHLWTFNTHEVYCWNVDKMCIFLSHLQYPCFAYIYKADIFFLATEAGLTLLFSFLLLTNRIRRASVQMKCPSGWKLKTRGVGFLNLITLLIQMFVSQKLDNKPEVLVFFFFFFFDFFVSSTMGYLIHCMFWRCNELPIGPFVFRRCFTWTKKLPRRVAL